jgi:phosphatidylserine/phosphatidylglycerophosphate/cardiolipin synthase-like enzyme
MPPIRRTGRRAPTAPTSSTSGASGAPGAPAPARPAAPRRAGRADRFSGPGGAAPATGPGPAAPVRPARPQPTTELAGFRIQGLDLGTIKNGTLDVALPLRKGTFLLPTHHADAKARVAERGTVKVHLEVDRDSTGALKVKGIRLQFDPRVSVLNPASSLQPSTGPLAPLWNKVQDLAGDVHLDAVVVSADGTMAVEGTVDRPWPLSNLPLNEQLPPGTFPKLKLDVTSLAAGDAIAEPAVPSGPPGKDVDLGGLLRSIGAMTDRGTFALKVHGKDTALSADLDGLHLRSEQAPLEVDIGGQVELDDTGTLHLALPQDPDAELVTGAGSADFHGDGTARLGPGNKPVFDGVLSGTANIDGVSGYVVRDPGIRVPLTINGANNIVMGSTRVRWDGDALALEQGDAHTRIRATLSEGATASVRGTSVRIPEGEANVEGRFSFGAKGGKFVVNDGTADVAISGANPEVLSNGVRVRLQGEGEVKLHGERIRLEPGALRPTGEGSLKVELRGDGSGAAPRLGELRYRLERDGSLMVRPASGTDELLVPLDALHRPRGKLVDPRGPAAGPIGGAAFQERITQLTGAKVTDGNAVKLLGSGTESRAERLELIKTAKRSIDVQTFIYKDDETGHEFSDALVAAAKRGVAVRLIVDGMGAIEEARDLIDEKPFYARLREAGVEVAVHQDPRTSPVGELFKEAATNPELGGVDDLEGVIANPARALPVLQRLVDVATGRRPASPETRARVATLLEKASTAPGATVPGISAARLAEIADGEPIKMNELLLTTRQLAELNYRWHEKYVVVDGKAAITGGMNVADEYLFGGSASRYTRGGKQHEAWRDADVRLDGPSATEVARQFAKNWKQVTGKDSPPVSTAPAVANGKKVQVVRQDPRLDGQLHLTNVMIESLKAMQPGEKAYLSNAYFLPSGALEGLKTALIDAAKRGVDVRIVTNSEGSTDMPQLNRAAVYHLEELLEAGVRIFERSKASTLHTKAASFGGALATVGSFNLDNRSAAMNSEAVALIYDAEAAADVEKLVVADMAPAVARELKLATLRQRIKDAGPANGVLTLFDDLM